MQPKSISILVICTIVTLAAFACGILLDFHILNRHIVWTVIKNGGPLAALTFATVHYFRSRPRVFEFNESDWKVEGETWKDVSITIPASRHKRGNTPTVIFLAQNDFVKDFGFVYKIDENGDVTICHSENRFLPPWKNFRVKIAM
jgi:hypothetical protein